MTVICLFQNGTRQTCGISEYLETQALFSLLIVNQTNVYVKIKSLSAGLCFVTTSFYGRRKVSLKVVDVAIETVLKKLGPTLDKFLTFPIKTTIADMFEMKDLSIKYYESTIGLGVTLTFLPI